ncbi:type II toxin-antitoxin system RelE/ParE family toxin [Methylobacterium oryzihabitans]|uniref:Toxin n=1 Tax=Methylobacterium oryzihabitans TaxID=2499852 RepID=A0A437PFZ2_9HYPH|nr:type II toxin-antitoxin system RelE/ParE family toxin [Methylobacterium oryzihabitans]RVU21186.1 type II toxin-antitoxin system RelE/ParE family toxin [Methylobacterium oryzihabitans]
MRIRLSAEARRDLAAIWAYSAKRWDEAQADRYVRLIAEGFENLAVGKVAGRSAEDVRPGYRKLAIGSHFVFYRISGTTTIDVVRILHQRMDVGRHL